MCAQPCLCEAWISHTASRNKRAEQSHSDTKNRQSHFAEINKCAFNSRNKIFCAFLFGRGGRSSKWKVEETPVADSLDSLRLRGLFTKSCGILSPMYGLYTHGKQYEKLQLPRSIVLRTEIKKVFLLTHRLSHQCYQRDFIHRTERLFHSIVQNCLNGKIEQQHITSKQLCQLVQVTNSHSCLFSHCSC